VSAVRRRFVFFVLVVIGGAVAGSLVGEVLGQLLPHGALHAIFSRSVSVGIPHFAVNLLALTLSFGLMLRVNFCTLVGVAAAVYLLRR
jgi:hypothetical protein